MKARKLIINGEEHEIGGSGGSDNFPGFVNIEVDGMKAGSSTIGIGTVSPGGKIEDWAMVSINIHSEMIISSIEIDGVVYRLYPSMEGYGIIRTAPYNAIFYLDHFVTM